MKLDTVFQEILSPEFKGFPYGAEPLRLDALGRQGWNLLRDLHIGPRRIGRQGLRGGGCA